MVTNKNRFWYEDVLFMDAKNKFPDLKYHIDTFQMAIHKLTGVKASCDYMKVLNKEDVNRGFVTLFGVAIDVDSYDVLLNSGNGFRRSVVICNLRDIIYKRVINKKKIPNNIEPDMDMGYILEMLKVDPNNFDLNGYIEECVGVKDRNTFDKSIIYNLVKSREEKRSISGFLKNSTSTESVCSVMSAIAGIRKEINLLGFYMFRNWICEESFSKVRDVSVLAFNDKPCLYEDITRDFRDADLECRYKTLSQVFPIEFINGIIRLGFSSNKDSLLYKNCGIDNGNIDLVTAEYVNSRCVSSSSSIMTPSTMGVLDTLVKQSDRGMVRLYNIIDILRAVNKDQGLIFAYDISVMSSNNKWLINYFKSCDVIDYMEGVVNFDNIVSYVEGYITRLGYLFDWGSMYTRNVRMGHNSFGVFSSNMMCNAGRVCNVMTDRLLKGFDNKDFERNEVEI